MSGGRKREVGAAPGRGGKGWWSARRKMTVVLELLFAAELEATSHETIEVGSGQWSKRPFRLHRTLASELSVRRNCYGKSEVGR